MSKIQGTGVQNGYKTEKRCVQEVSKSSDSMPVSPKLASKAVLAKPPYSGALHLLSKLSRMEQGSKMLSVKENLNRTVN